LVQKSLNEKITKFERLQKLYSEWEEQNTIIAGTADFSSIEKKILDIDEYRKELYEKVQLKEKLEESIEEYQIKYMDKEQCVMQIIEYEKELPKICPICGGKI